MPWTGADKPRHPALFHEEHEEYKRHKEARAYGRRGLVGEPHGTAVQAMPGDQSIARTKRPALSRVERAGLERELRCGHYTRAVEPEYITRKEARALLVGERGPERPTRRREVT